MGPPKPSISFVDDVVRVELAHHPLARPRLRIGSARGGWIRLALDGRTLAYARQDVHWQGLAWSRVSEASGLGLVPPLTSRLARTMSPARWVAHFARALFLQKGEPLLCAGAHALAPLDASNTSGLRAVEQPLGPPFRLLGAEQFPLQPRALCLSWSWRPSSQPNVLALRAPSPAAASRVTAWRKHAREGSLPPALVLWVSALDAYVVLDGHDRLHAAALEGSPPTAVSLHALREHDLGEGVRREAEARYLRAFEAEGALAARTRLALNQALVRSSSPWIVSTSSARSEPELAERFAVETRGLALPDDVARIFAR